ncbi:MAG: TonB-dependent receptor, partial [Tannerella sp.]|nr:TonB-dependent receptor [Tannerella sp.]
IFVHTNINQKAFHRFHSELTLRIKPWKEHVTLSLTPRFNRYASLGTDYSHTYNNWQLRGSLMANWKHWTFQAEGYTRWNSFWGEALNLGEQLIILSAGYNTPKWGAGINVFNPFTKEYTQGYNNYSALTPYESKLYTHDFGQIIVFNFSLNLNFGRKYSAADKRLDNSDADAGIMTGTK